MSGSHLEAKNGLQMGKFRGHPGLNQGPLDLQSNALPLSYIPCRQNAISKGIYHWLLFSCFFALIDLGVSSRLIFAIDELPRMISNNNHLKRPPISSSLSELSRDRIVVSTLRCGSNNPGSNPGHGTF